jgi:tetratricopeptide (TPR) repeat protein
VITSFIAPYDKTIEKCCNGGLGGTLDCILAHPGVRKLLMNAMRNKSAISKFKRLHAHLKSLLDIHPAKAIEEARALPVNATVAGVAVTGLRAGILIDAGACVKNKAAIEEGIGLLRQLLQAHPKQADLLYNLANGITALAEQEPRNGTKWFLATAPVRREARACFETAISSDRKSHIAPLALTNIGNAFNSAYRWVEAYDCYIRALRADPTNAIASTGAAKILLRCIDRGIGTKATLLSAAARHLHSAKQNPQRIVELAGERAYRELAPLLQRPIHQGSQPDQSRGSDYEKFVAANRLALSPTIEGIHCSLKRWDSLRIRSITEPAQTEFGVPPVLAMFNVMKSDYLAARYLGYQALAEKLSDSGLYSDTLDYALYGMVPSMLCLAQRACIDVLDKIAVATTEYFGITGNEAIYFTNRWFAVPKKGQPLSWHPALSRHIDGGNAALIALAELSLDVKDGGALYKKKAYRHASTHRFTILHDEGCSPSRESIHVEHCAQREFETHLIESLQLARAALLYFVEMIAINEARNRKGSDKVAPLQVPYHHIIRGEDVDAFRSPRRRTKR